MTKNYCSKCKVDIEKKVYLYSKENMGKALCRKCQGASTPTKTKKTVKKATISNNNFDYNMIKGRIAEALVEQLFIKLGYRVYRYGMENTIPGIMQLLGQVKDEVSNTIKRMPDLVIQNKTGQAYFIEVKFVGSERFSIANLKEDKYGEYPFPNSFFVVVSKNHIKCLSYEQLKAGKKISPEYKGYYLGDIKAFETDKKVIIDFCKYAIKFFEGV